MASVEQLRSDKTNDMKTNLADLYKTNPLKACRLALRRTADIHWKTRLDAIDKLLGNYGVEAITGNWQNGYWCNIVAAYSNAGDTYALTVMHVRGGWQDEGKFIISSFGDFVERNERKLGIN